MTGPRPEPPTLAESAEVLRERGREFRAEVLRAAEPVLIPVIHGLTLLVRMIEESITGNRGAARPTTDHDRQEPHA